jgi:MYXO-CTERM domain-containing protein
MRRLPALIGACLFPACLMPACLMPAVALAGPVEVLFIGNSYTFGRVDPVMSYNAASVNDLTSPERGGSFANTAGSNAFEPHPWSGVAGIFKQFTVQAGLDYNVSLSTRNAATLRGHFLNTNPAGWDLRGNIASTAWDKVVLQEQSDEPVPRSIVPSANPDWFRNYVDKIEDFVHVGQAHSYRERDFFAGATNAERTAACQAATGASATACNTLREIPANANANAAAELYLYQTWARPNLVHGAFATTTDLTTGEVTRTTTPANTFYSDLETMTEDLRQSFIAAAAQAATDGSGGFAGIAPVGEAFMRAVASGVATRDMWAADAATDGLIDLWFDDGTHASTYGSYLAALVLFGQLTGLDPALFGADEIAARDLGIGVADALTLQRVASDQLGFTASTVPAPASAALVLLALGLLGARRRRGQA